MTAETVTSSRRVFLQGTAASLFAGAWMQPFGASAQEAADLLAEYAPEFLDPGEWTFIRAAVARLIPSEGDGPGALDVLVPVFIDRQLAGDFGQARDWYMVGPHDASAAPELGWQTPLAPADVYRRAIPMFDTWCRLEHGAAFADLDAEGQDAALTALEKGDVELPDELRDFFELLLSNTKQGYFADPVHGGNLGMQSWVFIGFPGARANFTEWVGKHNEPYPLGPVSITGERA